MQGCHRSCFQHGFRNAISQAATSHFPFFAINWNNTWQFSCDQGLPIHCLETVTNQPAFPLFTSLFPNIRLRLCVPVTMHYFTFITTVFTPGIFHSPLFKAVFLPILQQNKEMVTQQPRAMRTHSSQPFHIEIQQQQIRALLPKAYSHQ